MAWLQLHFPCEQSQVELIEETLLALGAYSVSLTDARDEPLFEPPPGATPLWQHMVVTALFSADTNRDALLLELTEQLGALPEGVVLETLEDKPWERAWMDDFHPMQFGERLWIVPSWSTPPDPTAVNLRLDPGLAFGTGTHETTSLCLTWLEGLDLHNKTVLDFGCGSGVLAIAALLLGAKEAYACDIDPQALVATKENARLNQVEDRLHYMAPEELPEQQYDVVVANILAEPLIELAPQLLSHCRPQGAIGLSGILLDQAKQVRQAYSANATLAPDTTLGEWVLIHGTRNNT